MTGLRVVQTRSMEHGEWIDAVTAWTTWMVIEGKPKTTIYLRTYHVRRLAGAMQAGPWHVTLDDLVQWMASFTWGAETRRSYRASVRAFYTWATASGRIPHNP